MQMSNGLAVEEDDAQRKTSRIKGMTMREEAGGGLYEVTGKTKAMRAVAGHARGPDSHSITPVDLHPYGGRDPESRSWIDRG